MKKTANIKVKKERMKMIQQKPNVIKDKLLRSLQDIVSFKAPSWKGIMERRTGGPGWGAYGPGNDQGTIVSFNKNSTPCSSKIKS